MLSIAPITHQYVSHDTVEHAVNQREQQQHADRPGGPHLPPENRAHKRPGPDEQQTQSLWKIFLPPQIRTAADRTTRWLDVRTILLADRPRPRTVWATKFRRAVENFDGIADLAGGAQIGDMHFEFS